MLRSTLSLLSVSISSLLVSALVDPVQAGSVTWLTPSDGDAYTPGDTIVGRWTSDKPVPSPSFRLCVQAPSRRSDDNDDASEDDGSSEGENQSDNGDSACGEDVWPTIEHSDSDGSYLIHLALPNVTSVSHCYLQMVDDNGDKSSSPTFSFGSSGADDQTAAVTDEAGSDDADAESSPNSSPAPLASPASPASSTLYASPESSPASPSSILSTRSSSAASSPTTSLSNANLQSTSSQTPSLNETRMPAPTAAYAVPLSLVLSVLLAAGGLSLHQRRKLRAERKLEHEALKTRATLSRHSTLSFAGFMALGRGPSPAASSRSTSVNLMRAWRRDVSRYNHDHSHDPSVLPDDDHTYVAKSSDARSVLSISSRGSLPKREPRPQTREPFHTSSSQVRRTTVPAGLFRMGVSPMAPHRDDNDDDWGKLKRVDKRPHDVDDGTVNASVNDEVMSRYFEFSPIPLSPPAPREVSRVSVPERLHVRRYAENALQYDKALPPSPGVAEKDLYDVVARKLSRE
ncbi:hypothetical protein C8T65DRAFT_569636 [Cerioporus squamosus]|nr:hypothetical protein C8T65DRAFT_569636 [Cerioporus squamosus]